jgi:hypothetical protein
MSTAIVAGGTSVVRLSTAPAWWIWSWSANQAGAGCTPSARYSGPLTSSATTPAVAMDAPTHRRRPRGTARNSAGASSATVGSPLWRSSDSSASSSASHTAPRPVTAAPWVRSARSSQRNTPSRAMLNGTSFQSVIAMSAFGGARLKAAVVATRAQRGTPHARSSHSTSPNTTASAMICTSATAAGESHTRVISQFSRVWKTGWELTNSQRVICSH